jgi:AcrR family transcriptional regulator
MSRTGDRVARPHNRGRRQPLDTRRRIEEAAAELFTQRGYGVTSMEAIATAAGVHVQTIYLAYKTKAALLAAAAARLVSGEEDPAKHPGERAWARAIQDEPAPRRKIERYVRHIAEVAPRVTPMLDMLRATAPSEPEAAAFLAEMERGRREGPLQLLGPLATTGALRPGLTPARVADVVFALASPDVLRALVTMRGWSRARAVSWVSEALCRELLAEA